MNGVQMWDGVGHERASPTEGMEVGTDGRGGDYFVRFRRELSCLPLSSHSPGPAVRSLVSPLKLCFGWLVSFFLVFSFTFSLLSRSDVPTSLLSSDLCQYQRTFDSDLVHFLPPFHLLV